MHLSAPAPPPPIRTGAEQRRPAVALRGVSFWYQGDAAPTVANLDLTLPEGALVLLCGPSGSGKSTLLRLLLGLVPQLSGGRLTGSLSVLGHDPTRAPPRDVAAAGVGLLFQNPVESFVAERVGEEIAFGPENLGVPPAEIDRRVAESLVAVGLGGFERRRTRELSAGQQQRVALAGALALEPRLLLLDEPTAHLDPASARSALELIRRLNGERGTTILLSEHRLGLAAPMAERVLVLIGGRLSHDGPPRQVLAEPALPAAGVPVPRATQAAVMLRLAPPVPLTPDELAARSLTSFLASRAHEALPATCGPATLHDRAAALRFQGVSYAYPTGVDALSDVSFAVRPGEVVALVGPSGAGKSTLARLALGLLRPTRGRVELVGLATDATPFAVLARAGGLVLQNPLHQLLAERVDAELRLSLRDLPPEEADSRVDDLLDGLELRHVRERHPLTLSEGQRRRVALAAVLARRPRVLVLDEPTLGQDERQRSALVRIVLDLADTGVAVLAISHDAEFVNDGCDRVLALRDGRLVADVDLAESAAPDRLDAAGMPLADVPAAALRLSRLGRPVRARTLADLVTALRRPPVAPAPGPIGSR